VNNRRALARNALWAAYAVVVGLALWSSGPDRPFVSAGPLPAGKYVAWAALALFLGYSVWVSAREDLFASIGKIGQLHWGRQVGLDLYLGLSLAGLVIYLNEGRAAAALLWLVPLYVFGNLASLLYVAVHWDSLVGHLAGR
jgi:hypothetical protein